MGKLSIEGKASKEYAYDLMEVSVTFRATKDSSAAALERVMKQSEKFLELLEQAGVSIETIRIGEDSIVDNSFEKRLEVFGKRELKMCGLFDMDFANYIRELIVKNEFDADIYTQYKFSNLERIQKELIQLAVEDSKEKAMTIADVMGQKITGIRSVEIGSTTKKSWSDLVKKPLYGLEDAYCELSAYRSRKLQAPVEERSETVQVVWNIE